MSDSIVDYPPADTFASPASPPLQGSREPYKPAQFSKKELDDFFFAHADVEGGPEAYLAKVLANQAAFAYPEMFSYDLLRDGNHSVPGREGQRLSNRQIIQMLAKDSEGNDLDIDVDTGEAIFRGIVRQLPEAAAMYEGFKLGYGQTKKFIEPVVDLADKSKLAELVGGKRLKLATRVGDVALPTLGGIVGSVLYGKGAEEATNLVLGEEQPIFGEGRSAYEATKAGVNAAVWMLAPGQLAGAVEKGLSLGPLVTTKNILEVKRLPDQLFKTDPLVSKGLLRLTKPELNALMVDRRNAFDLMQSPAVQNLLAQGYQVKKIKYGPNKGKYEAVSLVSKGGGRTTKILGGFEEILKDWAKGARKNPVKTAAYEGLPVAGIAGGRYLAEEAGTADDQTRPAGTTGILMSEIAGGVSLPLAVSFTSSRVPAIYNYLMDIIPEYKASREAGLGVLKSMSRGVGVDQLNIPGRIKSKQQEYGMGQLYDLLIEEGHSPEGIEMILQVARQKVKEAKDKGIDITIGQATANPLIMTYERLMGEQLLTQADTAETAAKRLNKSILMTIVETLDKGTPDQARKGLQLASAIMEDSFSASLINKIDQSSQKLISAYEQIKKGTTDPDALEKLNRDFSRKFYENLKSLVKKSFEAQDFAWKKVRDMTGDTGISTFYNKEGEVLRAPNFYIFMQNNLTETPGAATSERKALAPLVEFLEVKAGQLGLPSVTNPGRSGPSSASSTPVDPLSAFNFGKEIKRTDKKLKTGVEKDTPIDLPEGFRVFQRSEEVPGVTGKVSTTSVVDPNGNRIEITRDPSNRIFPYQAEYIDGVAVTGRGVEESSDLLSANNLAEAVEQVAAQMSGGRVKFSRTPIDEVPAPATAASPGGQVTLKELIDIRKEAQAIGAQQRLPGGDPYKAKLAEDFAESVLDDIKSFEKLSGQDADTVFAYNTARALTQSHHDVFSRTFLTKYNQNTKERGKKVDVDRALDELFSTDPDLTLTRLRDLDSMYVYMNKNALEGVGEEIASIEGAMEGFLRNARAASMDSDTGQPNMAQLKKWLQIPENQKILDRFPTLKNDLNDVNTAVKLLKETGDYTKESARRNRHMYTFAQVASGGQFGRGNLSPESPATIIGKAYNGPEPFRQLNQLLDQALLKGISNEEAMKYADEIGVPFTSIADLREQSVAGLEQAVLNMAFNKSGLFQEDPTAWNPMKLRQVLFGKVPNSASNTSLMDWMVGNNIVSQAKSKQIKDILNSMATMQAYRTSGRDLSDLYKTTGPILEMYFSILGSASATKSQQFLFGNVGPGALVAAGKGAEASRQLFIKIPESMKIQALQELFENPELFITAMGKVKNVPRESLVRQVFKYFLDMGIAQPVTQSSKASLIEAGQEKPSDEGYPEVEFEYDAPQASVQAPQQNLMAQRFAQPTPTVIQPRPAAPAPAPIQPQGGANPQQRQQLAALFPNDPLLQAAGGQGGIGSLFS